MPTAFISSAADRPVVNFRDALRRSAVSALTVAMMALVAVFATIDLKPALTPSAPATLPTVEARPAPLARMTPLASRRTPAARREVT